MTIFQKAARILSNLELDPATAGDLALAIAVTPDKELGSFVKLLEDFQVAQDKNHDEFVKKLKNLKADLDERQAKLATKTSEKFKRIERNVQGAEDEGNLAKVRAELII